MSRTFGDFSVAAGATGVPAPNYTGYLRAASAMPKTRKRDMKIEKAYGERSSRQVSYDHQINPYRLTKFDAACYGEPCERAHASDSPRRPEYPDARRKF